MSRFTQVNLSRNPLNSPARTPGNEELFTRAQAEAFFQDKLNDFKLTQAAKSPTNPISRRSLPSATTRPKCSQSRKEIDLLCVDQALMDKLLSRSFEDVTVDGVDVNPYQIHKKCIRAGTVGVAVRGLMEMFFPHQLGDYSRTGKRNERPALSPFRIDVIQGIVSNKLIPKCVCPKGVARGRGETPPPKAEILL